MSWTAPSLGVDSKDASWRVQALALDANEGIALGDVDGDGKLDVVAGRNWYAAPDFVPRPLRTIEDWNGYVQSNGDFLMDIDGDGRLDVLAGSFLPTEVHWYRNPGPEAHRLGQLWPKQLLMDTKKSQNEAQLLADLDEDGRPEWVVNSWNQKNPLTVWRFQNTKKHAADGNRFRMVPAEIGREGDMHGLGVGDVNQDGRLDVLFGGGWYEQPSQNPWDSPWKLHADWQIQGSIPMLVADVDGDRRNDILVGKGHDYGLYYWKQMEKKADGAVQFDQREIDKSFSQPHALALADLDGDGVNELITGKRYYAHNGGDPGGKEMPILCYYRWNAGQGRFDRSVIESGHVGVGLQIATGDLNADGRVDIAVAGKSGTYLLFNPPPATAAKPATSAP
jgi:hypothetical protein